MHNKKGRQIGQPGARSSAINVTFSAPF